MEAAPGAEDWEAAIGGCGDLPEASEEAAAVAPRIPRACAMLELAQGLDGLAASCDEEEETETEEDSRSVSSGASESLPGSPLSNPERRPKRVAKRRSSLRS